MKKIVVIGSGGLAKETAWLIEEINAEKKEWNLIGFLDENDSNHGHKWNGIPVVGDFSFLPKLKTGEETVYAVCAVGDPRVKFHLVNKAIKNGLKFANLVHPSAKISRYLNLGVGNIISAGNAITVNVRIKNHVYLNLNCTIGHDALVEDYVNLFPGVNLSGNVQIREGCSLGTNSSVIQGVEIGKWSVIGAGAVVIDDLPPYCTAVGVPAKAIKFASPDAGDKPYV